MKKIGIRIDANDIKRAGLFFLIGFIISSYVFSQEETVRQDNDSLIFPNTVRFNLTNPLLFGDKAIIFGYERVLNNKKSFSVNVGRAYYPKLINASYNADSLGIDLRDNTKDKGLSLSLDYRIYLQKENKYPAPRGVYLGPYYSFNYFSRTNTWELNTNSFQGDLETNLNFNIHTIGFQLGYQFVFWDRITLDMILLGPGYAFYNFELKTSTSLTPDDESKLFEIINDYLTEKFPGYSWAIDAKEFEKSGSAKTTSLGFRYMIMVGYRF